MNEKVVELLEEILRQLVAIHQHVGPTCPDFREEEAPNGKREVRRLDG